MPASCHAAVGDFDPSGKPVNLTEFGGVRYAPDWDENWFGYGTVGFFNEYIEQYRKPIAALWVSSLLSRFCYTHLTDTEQETNGLLTSASEHKVRVKTIRKITRGQSR